MSGGTFGYVQYHFRDFAEQLEERIKSNNTTVEEEDFPRNYSEETIERLNFVLSVVKLAGFLAKEVDYLYSGDTGEDTLEKTFYDAISPEDFENLQGYLSAFQIND